MSEYAVIYEQDSTSWGAWVPDLPGRALSSWLLTSQPVVITTASTASSHGQRDLRLGADSLTTPKSSPTAATSPVTRHQHPRESPRGHPSALLVIGLAGCGSSSSSSSAGGVSGNAAAHVHFAKTKFLLHAGLAFGAFHSYIYKPFRRGRFTPALRHKLAIVKAGAAALFIYHEVKIALADARSSPLLSKLLSPLTGLEGRLSALRQSLHGGHLDPPGINAANANVTSIGSQSAHSGAAIHDLATPALG